MLLALAATFLAPAALADPPVPPLTGRVVDNAHVLSAGTVTFLNSRLQTFEQQTTNQLVIVTLPDLRGYEIEDWGLALLRDWGIGQKDKNNGVVLVVAPNDRQLRIEVGYGLEGNLPDATAYRIIQDEIIPRFKAGDTDGGVTAGVDAIIAATGGTYKPAKLGFLQASDAPAIFRFFTTNGFIIAFILFAVLSSLRRRWNPRRKRHEWYFSSSGGSSGGGWSSGGSSSGGFSGGGGSGGGGGASGRW